MVTGSPVKPGDDSELLVNLNEKRTVSQRRVARTQGSRCRFWACLKNFKSGGAWPFLVGISKPSELSM
jgi:hypothetical protein